MEPPVLAGGGDRVRREQYLDFIVGRSFRASVLGRDSDEPEGGGGGGGGSGGIGEFQQGAILGRSSPDSTDKGRVRQRKSDVY
jgi:hypothetical protein